MYRLFGVNRCHFMFSRSCGCLKTVRISTNRIWPGNVDCSAEAPQHIRHAKRSWIYAEIHASEPEQNPRNSLQHIETLSIVRLHQASPLVQMQWKRGASEPCRKAESGSQTTHSKRIARLSATAPVVQIPGGSGMPRNANVPWRCFWQGYPPNTLQNSTCI